MATVQISVFHDSDLQSQDGAETPRGHRYESSHANLSNLKLVFAEPERGLPSLRRGWRTPDPSPDRTGLPKCAPYAEYLEETEEALDVHGRGRPTDAHAAVRFQTPSPPPQAVPDFRMDSYVKHVAQAFRASWADQSEDAEEAESPVEVEAESPADSDQKPLLYPLCASFGSRGHPFSCNAACKYATKGKGCKDGADCDHCHLCTWKKPVAQNRRTRPAGRPRKPRQNRGDA